MVVSMGWFLYLSYLNWDVVLTLHQRWNQSWFPMLLLVVGYGCVNINLRER